MASMRSSAVTTGSSLPAVNRFARYLTGIRKERTSGISFSIPSLPASAADCTGESGGIYQTIGKVRYSGCSGKAGHSGREKSQAASHKDLVHQPSMPSLRYDRRHTIQRPGNESCQHRSPNILSGGPLQCVDNKICTFQIFLRPSCNRSFYKGNQRHTCANHDTFPDRSKLCHHHRACRWHLMDTLQHKLDSGNARTVAVSTS